VVANDFPLMDDEADETSMDGYCRCERELNHPHLRAWRKSSHPRFGQYPYPHAYDPHDGFDPSDVRPGVG
jgi:hypothetical protein